MRKWLTRVGGPVVLALLVVLLVGGVSCKGGGERASKRVPAEKQELTIRIAGDPSTFDPQLAEISEEISVVKQLFRGLFTYDQDLNVVPAVAKEVPTKENGGISEDGLVYTIALREDAAWSDGTPLTAHDFVYAFQRLFDPEAGARGYYYSFYTAIKGSGAASEGKAPVKEIGVTAVDDHTLRIELEHPQPTLPTLLALWPAAPLREDLIEQHGAAWTKPGNLVGNGPFVLTKYAPEREIVLTKNTAYVGEDEPTLERLVYRVIPDDNAALLAYQQGEIDVTPLAAADVARFENDPELFEAAQLETFAIFYNEREAPFDDPLVRRAISSALDRDAYVATVQSGAGIPATSWLPPGMPGASANVGGDLGFNIENAQSLLAQAGYPNGEGFPTVTFTVADDPTNLATAEFVQQQLKENLGIEVKIESLEEGVFGDRFFAGEFQMSWLSWFGDYADPENWLPQQFASDGGFNVMGYSNPQVDALLAQAATETDPAKRLALYEQAHKIVIDDQALTPVYYPQRSYLVRDTVAGLVPTVLDAAVPGDWFVSNVQILEEGSAPASLPERDGGGDEGESNGYQPN